MAVEAGWARLAAVLAPVARLTGAGPVHLVALAPVALAVAVAARPEGPLPALAAPRELLAGRVVAGALVVAATAPPARLAQAVACLLVTLGVVAAIAGAGALRAPPVGLTGAFACLLVALAMLAEADVLALGTPAVEVAGALARHVLALPIGMAGAHFLAVWTPELSGTLCGESHRPQHCPQGHPQGRHQLRPEVPTVPLDHSPPSPPLQCTGSKRRVQQEDNALGNRARSGEGRARAFTAPSLMICSGKSPQHEPGPPW